MLRKRVQAMFLLMCCSMFMLSCGASHHLSGVVMFKGPDYSYNQLRQGGLIIGGISSSMLDLTPEQRLEYSMLISNVFLEKHKDVDQLHVINTNQFVATTGRRMYLDLMKKVDGLNKMPDIYADSLKTLFPNTRYFLYADIENENVIDNQFDEYVEEEGKEKLQTNYEKTYLLTIEFRIYDLIEKQVCLRDRIHNEAKRTDSRTTRTGCVDSCVDSIIQDLIWGDAAEIDRTEVIAKITEKFAKELRKIQ